MAFSDIPRSSAQGSGGLQYLLIGEWSDIVGDLTIDASNNTATFTIDSSAYFVKYNPNLDTAKGESPGTGETTGVHTYLQQVTAMFSDRNHELALRQLRLQRDAEVFIVTVDTNGNALLYGDDQRGLILKSPVYTSGTSLGESNSTTMVWEANTRYAPLTVSSTVLGYIY